MKMYNAQICDKCNDCGEIIFADWTDLTKKDAEQEVIRYYNTLLQIHKKSSKHKELMLEKKNYEKEVNQFIKEQ